MTKLSFSKYFLLISLLFLASFAWSQTGEVRGIVYDKESGEPIIFTPVFIQETMVGKTTDINGFFSISRIKPGSYTLKCYAMGYDTSSTRISIGDGGILTQNIYLKKLTHQLKEVEISGEREKRKTDTRVSNITITTRDMKQLPSFGGEPDLAQYLQILPGAVFSGDQGGQLYIRGGTPVQNKVLLDGMTIYNPFHSIGLFSVFDADIIRTADVSAGGFNAQYGGRIGSIVDVTTREGNKRHTAGKISVNTMASKFLLEGPISKFADGSSFSYILSNKTSYLNRTSETLYPYADPEQKRNGLPFSFNDTYGKLSLVGSNGSKINVYGFNFLDEVNYPQTKYNWNSYGLGTNFFIIPEGSTIINGAGSYSKYAIEQVERDNLPRKSEISGFNIAINFTNFIGKDDIKYGFEINGFSTDFAFVNSYGRNMSAQQNTTELCAFVKYKKNLGGRVILESGIRSQYYASLGNLTLEPRLGAKYNMTDKIRIKGAFGYYSQNLMAAVSDQDVVNLFYGFLSSPEGSVSSSFGDQSLSQRVQTAYHYVAGMEFDIGQHAEINVEAFYKDFTQLTNINRDKQYDDDEDHNDKPERLRVDYVVEKGNAYGADIRFKYEYRRIYFWSVYSLTYVTRNDGTRSYFPNFDRRHNLNFVGTYAMGKDKSWNVNARWNFGSGFPFTQTQGVYEQVSFINGVSTDYTSQNGQLGYYYTEFNTGRLPYFHRLDLSVSKKITFSETRHVTLTAAVTNAYNRQNIFYFDRANYERIDQLPIIPTLGINYSF